MKTTQNEHSLAVRGANYLNKLKQDMNGTSHAYMEWLALLKKYRVPYYVKSINVFIKDGILVETGMKIANNRGTITYAFSNKIISKITLAPIYQTLRKEYQKPTKKARVKKEGIDKIANDIFNSPEINATAAIRNLSNIPDSELVKELRNRGFEVTAEKVTTIKL